MVVCVFFFFKQKTAYEILTCDWSSDVCSSDLLFPLYRLLVDMSSAGQGSVKAVDAQEAGMDEADLTELTKDAFQKIAEYLNGELEGMYNTYLVRGKAGQRSIL